MNACNGYHSWICVRVRRLSECKDASSDSIFTRLWKVLMFTDCPNQHRAFSQKVNEGLDKHAFTVRTLRSLAVWQVWKLCGRQSDRIKMLPVPKEIKVNVIPLVLVSWPSVYRALSHHVPEIHDRIWGWGWWDMKTAVNRAVRHYVSWQNDEASKKIKDKNVKLQFTFFHTHKPVYPPPPPPPPHPRCIRTCTHRHIQTHIQGHTLSQ